MKQLLEALTAISGFLLALAKLLEQVNKFKSSFEKAVKTKD